jgi:hypothetical protein
MVGMMITSRGRTLVLRLQRYDHADHSGHLYAEQTPHLG